MEKPKVALYWNSSCGGCEESILDLGEKLIDIISAVDIILWPVAMDYKFDDIRLLKAGEIAASFINGAVRMDEQVKMARLLREKSRIVIAQGSCAHLGGVYGLANFFSRESILDRSYREVPFLDNPDGVLPGRYLPGPDRPPPLSGFHERVKTLNDVIDVDYFLPGCPTPPELIMNAFRMLLEDSFPAKKSVLAEKQSLCKFCPREKTFPEKISEMGFQRPHLARLDPERCFLAQDVICLGPSTRGGCGASCINGNMPCRGCFGPLDSVMDQGGKSVSFLASLMDADTPEKMKKIASSVPDPGGLFYRYALAHGILKGRKFSKKT